MFGLFASLRGKLILTYTLVTVLALLALEVVVLLLLVFGFSLTNADRSAYLSDVIYTLYPIASRYMQPEAVDQNGLQVWLDQVYTSRHASSEPIGGFDSPAAILIANQPLYALSPDRVVLAQSSGDTRLIGQVLMPPNAEAKAVLDRALEGNLTPLRLYTELPNGTFWMAVPVMQGDAHSKVLGALVMTIAPPPPLVFQLLPYLAGAVFATGILLLIMVAPFGALFGFVMSRGLTRRLANLSNAADAWSEGNFSVVPQDRSNDEISALGKRLRNMAERIQALVRNQQELAMMEERNRIARELHDTVKQQNFATLMQLRAARNRLAADPAGALEALQEAERLVKTSQQELGLMITELRPAALDGQGLVRALELYIETWSHQANIPARFEASREARLTPAVEQSLYRVAQEALANVARHSHAANVVVHLDYGTDIVSLTIADDGTGIGDTSTRGLGLQTMQERLAALGGTLRVTSAQDHGTTVSAIVPSTHFKNEFSRQV